MIVVLVVLAAVAGCTLVWKSNHVDLRENRAVVGTNRVTDIQVSPR